MQYLESWIALRASGLGGASPCNAELARELSEGHPLFGAPVAAIAKRSDSDDVLFQLRDGTGRVAEVHLTFQHPERPPWPRTRIFPSLEAWADERMEADHEALKGRP